MKQLLFLCCYCLGYLSGFGQQQEPWQSFWNKDTTLFGFKNVQGQVVIPPKYSSMFFVKRLDHIAAVSEDKAAHWKSYYLTRTGKQAAQDSLYIVDNSADCESEGFIRFRDPKTDKAGMLNRNGEVVIPALYNALTPVHNGMVMALRDAHKEYWDTVQHSGCDHFSWTGGHELLIDTMNRILVDSFPYNRELDFASVQMTATPGTAPDRISFKGTHNQFYSFIDMDKEFKRWLQQELLKQLTTTNMIKHSFTEICTWRAEEGWVFEKAQTLLSRNQELLKTKLACILDNSCDYSIVGGELNQFIYTTEQYNIYFNNCGVAESWRYPTKSIIIDHRNGTGLKQDHFEFLRTPQGYKLIAISLGQDKLQ